MTGWCVTENFRRPPRRARQAAVGGAPRHPFSVENAFGELAEDANLDGSSETMPSSRGAPRWCVLVGDREHRDRSRVHLREGRHRDEVLFESVETRDAASRCSICNPILAAPWRSTLPSCRATHAQGESEDRLRMTFVSAMVEPMHEAFQYLWGKYKDKVDEI